MYLSDHCFLVCSRSKTRKLDAFLSYKLVLVIFLLSMLIYGWYEQMYSGLYPYWGEHVYTDYLTNWVDVFCSIWAITHVIYATDSGVPYGERVLPVVNSVAPCITMILSIAYWTLVTDDRQTTTLISLYQHAGLTAIVMFDFLIYRAPLDFHGIIYPCIVLGSYAMYSFCVYKIFGSTRDETYSFLAFEKDLAGAVKVSVMLACIVPSVVFTILYLISHIKHRIFDKVASNESDKQKIMQFDDVSLLEL